MDGDTLVRDRPPYQISTARARLQQRVIVDYLARSYWADKRPAATVVASLDHSLNFGLYHQPGGEQVGFARLVTDYTTFAYLADVFVLEAHRGKGLGVWLMEVVIDHPRVANLRRWHLATADAHGLYRRFGFVEVDAAKHMERLGPNG